MISRALLCSRPGPLADRVGARLVEAGLVVDRDEEAARLLERLPEGSGPRATLVYLAASFDRHGLEPDLDSAEEVFDACATGGLGHVVVVSSAAAGEPSAHYPGMVESGRQLGRWTGNTLAAGWLELERKARLALADGCLTLLRPAAVLVPGGRDFWSRTFSRPVATTPWGFDPSLQLLAAEDLAARIAALVPAPPVAGAARLQNVAPCGTIPLRQALMRARVWRLPLPYSLLFAMRKLLSALGLAARPEILDYLRYPFTIAEEPGCRESVSPGERQRRRSSLGALRKLASAAATAADDTETSFDPFGLDPAYIARFGKTLFRFLHDVWWRIDPRGLEQLPRQGGAVLAGVHRGFQPWDGVMAMHLIASRLGRHIRFLVHPSLLKPPCLTPFMCRLGGVPACGENADWVLGQGEILAIFPEGIRGAFRLYDRKVYQLGKFGRDEFIRFALRHQVPIVPFVTLGSAEIYPIFGGIRWSWFRRKTEWPFLPITPTLGLVPLPSKWHTRFLERIETGRFPPAAAGDPEVVRRLSLEVREKMQAALDDLQQRRRHLFWGDLAPEVIA